MNWQDATNTLLSDFVNHKRIGVICDVDGTLSPIVDNPAAATIHPQSKAQLTAMRPVLALLAFVSGRAATDIHERVGIEGAVYMGNHGMERWVDGGVQVDERVAAYRANLERVLAEVERTKPEGIEIEDKGATASIHYRRTNDPQQTATQFKPQLDAIAAEHDIHVHSGKMVFELRPPVDMNKGTAFRKLVSDYRLDAAIYLGDDVTDVDALKAAGELREAGTCYGVGLGVRHADDTPKPILDYADVLADDVDGVSDFLDWLSSALSASST